MSYRSTINFAVSKIKKVLNIPEDDKTHDANLEEIVRSVWAQAVNYDPMWDSD